MRAELLRGAALKTLYGVPLDGASLLSLASQYLAAMNPTAGSFFIIDRMQRHFATFATLFPDNEVLESIYYKILAGGNSQGGVGGAGCQ